MEISEQQPQETHEEKMERMLGDISAAITKMNRRDRARMIWGSFHAILGLIPLVILLWSLWYISNHSKELISEITDQTVQRMTGLGGSEAQQQSLIDQFMKQFQQGGAR